MIRPFGSAKSEQNQFSGANSGKIQGARSDAIFSYRERRTTKKIAGIRSARRETVKWLIFSLLLLNVEQTTFSSSRLKIISFYRF